MTTVYMRWFPQSIPVLVQFESYRLIYIYIYIGNCHFLYQYIVAKLKGQYYIDPTVTASSELGVKSLRTFNIVNTETKGELKLIT